MFHRTLPLISLCCALLPHALATPAGATTLQLTDGRTLVGDMVKVSGVAEDPTNPKKPAGEVLVTRIVLVDDGLRRTFVNMGNVREVLDDPGDQPVVIRVWQDYARHGAVVGGVGRTVRVTPFDEFGRRVYEVQGPGGVLPVVQGITEVTPLYTRVRGLSAEPRSYVWDLRLATSSIPRDTLSRILLRAAPQNQVDARLQIVRLYLQSERYRDARIELERVIRDFPQLEDMQEDVRQLRRMSARSVLDEIELRRAAGQRGLALSLLERFPADEVDGATLERVRELLADIRGVADRCQRVNATLAAVVEGVQEPSLRRVAEETRDEIAKELNEASLDRMAAFMQLADAENLTAEAKASLAISGWLIGADQATDNLQTALSLFDVRAKVVEYLREPEAPVRAALLAEVRDMQAGTVPLVAELLKLMKPPLPLPGPRPDAHVDDAADDSAEDDSAEDDTAASESKGPDANGAGPQRGSLPVGAYRLAVKTGPEWGEASYSVQLPPEYDPLRKHPCIVTLNGSESTPEMQLDFWAGSPGEDGARRGQAMRHGYVVLAVDWQAAGQGGYSYSAREHAAVLAACRDAFRRLSIDTDRVFLTGHDSGGDAAWDIGLAHPDLWAGVMPFLARADKYVGWCDRNAKHVPWYLVAGELDGGKVALNARELDRYLERAGHDATLVEYLGRGPEPLFDEVQRAFDWMGRKRRAPAPEEFEVASLRPWDNFFWWAEFGGLPGRSMVHPEAWPPGRGVRAARLRGRIHQRTKVTLFAQAERVTAWLSPEVVDFDKPVTVELNGAPITTRSDPVAPSLEVLLEDARTRGDRLKPFWARVTAP